jgi:deazaflavin-dependent oxidoreductase (nitroreductase family)
MSIPAVSPGRSIAHRVGYIAATSCGQRIIREIGDRVDPSLIRCTRGRLSMVWPFPAVLVTHTGARSGKLRRTALVYFTDGGRVILIATNFGAPRNPSWYYNIKTDPVVGLYGRGIKGSFIAEEINGDERSRVFQRAKDAPGPYGKYQEAADGFQQVPVMALRPLSETSGAAG